MTTEADNDKEASTPDDHPRVLVHSGLRLEPAELEDLPDNVREIVEGHIEFSDARELEVRHYGGNVFNVMHRHGEPDGGDP